MEERNSQAKNNSLKTQISEKKHLEYLKKIFHVSPLYPNKFLPIIISTDDIPQLYFSLKKEKNTKESNLKDEKNDNNIKDLNIQNKIEILTILMALFKSNRNLINIIILSEDFI